MVVLTFQLLLDCETVIFCFLCCFLSFILSLVSFYRIFRRIFRFSSQSHSPLSPPLPACFRPFVRLFRVLGLRKKYGLLCHLNCRQQVKRRKVPFNNVWKENIVFSAKKKRQRNNNNNDNKNRETKYYNIARVLALYKSY